MTPVRPKPAGWMAQIKRNAYGKRKVVGPAGFQPNSGLNLL